MSGWDLTDLTGLLDPATWYAVTPPDNYDSASASNIDGASILRISPSATGTPAIPIAVGQEQPIAVPMNHSDRLFRFHISEVAFYAKPDSGTGTGQRILWA